MVRKNIGISMMVLFILFSCFFSVPSVVLAAKKAPVKNNVDPEKQAIITGEYQRIKDDNCPQCKNFKLLCEREAPITDADIANGISRKVFIALGWLYMGGDPNIPYMLQKQGQQQWHEGKEARLLLKINNEWKLAYSGYATYDYICGGSR